MSFPLTFHSLSLLLPLLHFIPSHYFCPLTFHSLSLLPSYVSSKPNSKGTHGALQCITPSLPSANLAHFSGCVSSCAVCAVQSLRKSSCCCGVKYLAPGERQDSLGRQQWLRRQRWQGRQQWLGRQWGLGGNEDRADTKDRVDSKSWVGNNGWAGLDGRAGNHGWAGNGVWEATRTGQIPRSG